MRQLGRLIHSLCATVAAISLGLMITLGFIDSIGRQISHPVLGAQEVGTYTLLIFFFAASSLVERADSHIRVGLFRNLLGARLKAVEMVFTRVVEVAASGFIVYLVWVAAARALQAGSISRHFRIEVAPFLLVAMGFAALATITVIVRQFIGPQRGRAPSGKDADHPQGSAE